MIETTPLVLSAATNRWIEKNSAIVNKKQFWISVLTPVIPLTSLAISSVVWLSAYQHDDSLAQNVDNNPKTTIAVITNICLVALSIPVTLFGKWLVSHRLDTHRCEVVCNKLKSLQTVEDFLNEFNTNVLEREGFISSESRQELDAFIRKYKGFQITQQKAKNNYFSAFRQHTSSNQLQNEFNELFHRIKSDLPQRITRI